MMKERIARTLATQTIAGWGEVEMAGRPVEQVVDLHWQAWLDDADAVLDAMRQPTGKTWEDLALYYRRMWMDELMEGTGTRRPRIGGFDPLDGLDAAKEGA